MLSEIRMYKLNGVSDGGVRQSKIQPRLQKIGKSKSLCHHICLTGAPSMSALLAKMWALLRSITVSSSMYRFLLILVLALSMPFAHATPQIFDEIILDGNKLQLVRSPFLALMKERDIYKDLHPFLNGGCTASILGFQAKWEIVENKLFLLSLVANPCSGPKEVPLNTFFQQENGPVFAYWYSGPLKIPSGLMIDMDLQRFESYIVLMVQRGKVISREENVPPPPIIS